MPRGKADPQGAKKLAKFLDDVLRVHRPYGSEVLYRVASEGYTITPRGYTLDSGSDHLSMNLHLRVTPGEPEGEEPPFVDTVVGWLFSLCRNGDIDREQLDVIFQEARSLL